MGRSARILIVEDQYFVAIDCESMLQSAGHTCVGLASTASEAVELAERERPDLVLMDIRLASRTDGVDAAIVIYERLGVRCIFTSGHADDTTRRLAERAKPLGWVDKPYSERTLLHAVDEALGQMGVGKSPAPALPQHLSFH